MNTYTISAGDIRTFYMTVLTRLGFDAYSGRTLSEIFLATSDLHAITVLRKRVAGGKIDPKARPVLEKNRRRAVMIGGGNTEPHLTCLLAMETACEIAAAEGVGMVLARGMLPVTRLRIYEKVAAAHGLHATAKEAVYNEAGDADYDDITASPTQAAKADDELHMKMTHSFLAVDPGHFGDRDEITHLMVEFAKQTGDTNARAPRAIDPAFENEGTSRTYTGSISAVFKNRDLIDIPSVIVSEWLETAAALDIKESSIPTSLFQS